MTTTKRPRSAQNVQARRAKGIAMLVGGARHSEVMKACKVSQRQVTRWAALPEVRQQVESVQAEAERSARDVLVTGAREAAEAVLEVMRSADGAGDRLRAALAVLDRTGHGPTEKREVSGPGGGPQQTQVVIARDEALAIARRKGDE